MKSLIVTILYLAKDTLHRWFARLSSPLARVLVVFFLTLSALAGMGSYAISAKIITDRIVSNGGDTVFINAFASEPITTPTATEIRELLGAESCTLLSVGSAMDEDGKSMAAYTYDFRHMGQIMPLLHPSGKPTILYNQERWHTRPGPTHVTINGMRLDAVAYPLPQQHLLNRLIPHKALLLQPESLPFEAAHVGRSAMIILRLRNLQSAQEAMKAENYFRTYFKLEGAQAAINSAADIFDQLENALSKQLQCRIAFCLGISVIVGILLTALAGIEYRQNEYIYTLMKSFGIRPFLLVGAFIAENLLLVFGSAAAALYVFMQGQSFIVQQLLKLGNYRVTLPEIATEVHLIAATLLVCVFISAIPVFIAAHRDIGRVLK